MALDFRNSCLKNFNELLIYNLRQRNCNINMVKKLLAHKVDVNYKDCFLNTSLHYVVQNCSDKLDLIREILNMEGNPNAVNAEGNSPLHLAVLKSNVHVILELIKFGGDVRLTNKSGNTPLHVAAMRGKPCIIETLLKSDTSLINFGNIRENTPLHIAVIHGKSYAAEMLIRHGADVNCRNLEGNTPLNMAVIHDKEDMIKILIKSGADLNCANKEGKAPLHLGVAYSKHNIVQNLLVCGANVHCRDVEGNTPLHLASAPLCSTLDIIDELIKFKAEVNCMNHDCLTPMHLAAINGRHKVVQKLRDNGACVNCTDGNGNTPLHFAVSHDQPSVIECLISNGAIHCSNAFGHTPLHFAILEDKLDMIQILISGGADIDCKDAELNTPLHLAAIHDKPDMAAKLLGFGAKKDLVNKDSHTPVQAAAVLGHVNIINVLFQNGVRVKLRNQGRRYISSFAQSLIQQTNAQIAAGGNAQPAIGGGATGASQPATQNNSTVPSISPPASFLELLAASEGIHPVPPAGLPLLAYNLATPGTSTGSSTHTLASSFMQNMQQNIQQLLSSTPGQPQSQQLALTAGPSSQSANVASTSHAGNTSSVSSQTVESLAPAAQGSSQSSNNEISVVLTSLEQDILPNIPELSMSLLPSPTQPASGNTAISPVEAFTNFFLEADSAVNLGPLNIAQPPTLVHVTNFTPPPTVVHVTNLALPNGLVGNDDSDESSESVAIINAPQPAQNAYVTFLDELDAENDPMSWNWAPLYVQKNSKVEEIPIIDNLVKFYGIHGRNRSGNEHLQRALLTDDPNDIASLLQSNIICNVSRISRKESSFLHLAAVYGKPNLLKALIQSGAVVDCKNSEFNTPLHFATFCGEAEAVDILCQHGANIDVLNRRNSTPLKYAFSYCRKSALKHLGRLGAKRYLLAAQALAKYDVLKKGLYLTRHKVLKTNCVFELFSHVEKCCDEVLLMKQKRLDKNFSFYQFVIQAWSNSEPISQSPHAEAVVRYLIEISSKAAYVIYYDFLVSLIITKLEKSILEKKLLDLVDSAVEDGKILLNRRLFSYICKYISNVDIFNLLLAFADDKFEN